MPTSTLTQVDVTDFMEVSLESEPRVGEGRKAQQEGTWPCYRGSAALMQTIRAEGRCLPAGQRVMPSGFTGTEKLRRKKKWRQRQRQTYFRKRRE